MTPTVASFVNGRPEILSLSSMRSLIAIAALLLGLLLVGAAIDVTSAHDHTASVSDDHHQDAHDPADHSHPPGEDLAHQLVFHDCAPCAGLAPAEVTPASVEISAVPLAQVALLHSITVSPPDRPPSR
ncbi:MAG: hypothetical protein ABL967_20610 [Bryobacteraceae bacterium]